MKNINDQTFTEISLDQLHILPQKRRKYDFSIQKKRVPSIGTGR